MRTLIIAILVILAAACGRDSPPDPTNEPEATLAPAAVPPTAVPVVDSATEIYRDGVSRQGQEISEALQVIVRLIQDPKLTDNAWIMEMGVSIARIELAAEEIGKLTPPPAFAEFHTAMVTASTTCSNFATTLSSALDNANAEQMAESSSLLQECADQLKEAVPLIPQ